MLPLTMTPLAEPVQNIFDSRDLDGNESPPPSDSDYDSSDFADDTIEGADLDTDTENEPESAQKTSTQPTSTRQQQVRCILDHLDQENLKLVDFLDGLSWGDDACIQDPKIRVERTIFLQSARLSAILTKWAVPPRKKGSLKRRAAGAMAPMSEFISQHITNKMDHELEALAPSLHSPPSVDVEKETLHGMSFQNMLTAIQQKAPTLCSIFESLAYQDEQRKRNTHKDPEKVCPAAYCLR